MICCKKWSFDTNGISITPIFAFDSALVCFIFHLLCCGDQLQIIVSASWTVNAMPSQVTSTNHPTSGIPAMVPEFGRNKMLQGMKQYICSTCGKQYSIKGSLQRHVRYECGVEPQFCCPYCSKRSHRKSNLSQHIRRNHFSVSLCDSI
ncbi:uncharacterized protein LOC126473455 [Schistocerca serialis cubense]|uniref:uncharacterized protein LOC126473455 n=1 Tax=Schistocerca serialis cubense TaxID=2023355 RepID=UPI00214ED152|nr:uncharacterized protein LOC126473455 [Schistocerca serialis cubense]